jgi:leucyl-tRNA synthetase
VFYGTGDPGQLSKQTGARREILERMRQEFQYWYPVDLRNSGKDLVGNHLSFFILHHVALFERKYWPRAIGVNGFMLAEGRPMHKSQGNFIPLWKACEDYGADSVRCTILLAAEGMDDPDWRSSNAREVQARLESLLRLVEDTASLSEHTSNGHLESWLMDRIHAKTKSVSEAIEKLKTRTALSSAMYDVWNDLRWYERRTTRPDSATVKTFISTWIRLLAPFSPHLAEEAWLKIGQKGFVSIGEWPKIDESKIDARSDELENLVKQTLEDTQEIITTAKITPKKAHYYTAAKWKWQVYKEAVTRAETRPEAIDGLIRDMIAAKSPAPKDLPKFAAKIIKQVRTMPTELRKRRLEIGEINELAAFNEARSFFAKELKVEVEAHSEDDPKLYDPKGRSRFAEPYRPAIFIE